MADEAMIQKVRSLLVVAGDDRCSEGERSNALTLATKLKAKHGINDDDLVEHDEVGGLFEGMFSSFRWGRVVRDETDRIWKDVDALVDRMVRDEKGSARAEAVNAVFGAIRNKLGDATGAPDAGTLKARRDQALYDYFAALDHQDRKQRAEWEKDDPDPEMDPEVAKMYEDMRLERLYDRVASRVKDSHASLNKLQVEKIVKRIQGERARAAKFAQRQADRERLTGQPCVYCGSAEPRKRPMHAKNTKGKYLTYEMDENVTVHYQDRENDTDPFPAHSRCWVENRDKVTEGC